MQLHQGSGLRGKTSLAMAGYLGFSLKRDLSRLSEITRFQPI